jgi:hypothetical protein
MLNNYIDIYRAELAATRGGADCRETALERQHPEEVQYRDHRDQ